MKQHELEILKEELGLTHITDPEVLRAAIEQKLASMNALDRIALQTTMGRRLQEAEEKLPGDLYSPTSGCLGATAAFCIAISVGATLLVLKTEIWISLQDRGWNRRLVVLLTGMHWVSANRVPPCKSSGLVELT